jgi:hypothetical protein
MRTSARTSAQLALHRVCTAHDTTPPVLPFKVTVESFVTAAATPGAYYYIIIIININICTAPRVVVEFCAAVGASDFVEDD